MQIRSPRVHVPSALSSSTRDCRPISSARRALGREFDRCSSSAEQLARALGISVRSLRRKLAERGTTYHALLDELRLDLSCQLLRCTDDSIDVIAERLGFSDRSGFQRAFRRYTGQAPSAYRILPAQDTRAELVTRAANQTKCARELSLRRKTLWIRSEDSERNSIKPLSTGEIE